MKFDSHSENDTINIAHEFAQTLRQGDIVALCGDMGAGKTAFVKGIAGALCPGAFVASPTFTLVNEYEGALPVYHFDLYRLIDSPDAEWLDDYLFGDGVCVIEWADVLESLETLNIIRVEITKNSKNGDHFREIIIRHREEQQP